MDDPRSKQSLADDPAFLAILSELDRGLSGKDDLDELEPPVIQGRSLDGNATPPPARSPRLQASPSSQASTAAPFPANHPLPAAAPASDGRRPLLELFPPAPSERLGPRGPLLGEAVGLRLPQRRTRRVDPPPAAETPTYANFYGLNEKPFSLSSDPRFLYRSASHDRASQALLNAIRRGDGMVVITGANGIGKTMLCRAVVEQLDRRTLTSYVANPFVTVVELLKIVLVDFGVVSHDDLSRASLQQATQLQLTATLQSFLASLSALQASAVLIVDEAHDLPADMLGQIGLLADQGTAPLLQIVLVGHPDLLVALRRPELNALDRRITVRCELGPLTADEITGYVVRRLATAGASPRVEFDDGALMRLFELSGGVPRVVNLICDRALTRGHELSASVIDRELVEAAMGDLHASVPIVEARRALGVLPTALALILLMLGGAGAAAWVFRARVQSTFKQWQAVPSAPAGPMLRLSVPLAAVPPPADGDPSGSASAAPR